MAALSLGESAARLPSVPSRKFATIPTDANSLPRIEIRCAAVQKNLRDMTLVSDRHLRDVRGILGATQESGLRERLLGG